MFTHFILPSSEFVDISQISKTESCGGAL